MYNQQKQVPFPPGWEAKYDPASRRWYFINHFTQKTQWNDPRVQPATTSQQPAATSQQRAQPAATSQQRAQPDVTSQPTASATTITASQHNSDLSSIFCGLNFNDSNTELMRDVLENIGGNIKDAQATLERMGLVQSTSKAVSFEAVVIEESVQKNLTPREKAEMTTKLSNKFPQKSRDELRMGLEASSFDLEVAEALLMSQDTNTRRRAPVEETSSTSVERPAEPISFSPVVFGEDEPAKPTSQPSSKSVASSKSAASSTNAASSKSATSSTVKPSVAKKVRSKTILTSKPKPSSVPFKYTSKLQNGPVGPNPANLQGPDPSLLLGNYTQAIGPDPKNRKGPQILNSLGADRRNCNGRANLELGSYKLRN